MSRRLDKEMKTFIVSLRWTLPEQRSVFLSLDKEEAVASLGPTAVRRLQFGVRYEQKVIIETMELGHCTVFVNGGALFQVYVLQDRYER